MLQFIVLVLACVACLGSLVVASEPTWTLQSKGFWPGREGVMGAWFNNSIYVIGGRGTFGLGFFNDVWRSEDEGATFTQVVANGAAPFEKRAYHIVLVNNECMYLMGGQNFGGFFNNVFISCNGFDWKPLGHAPWHPRAGLAATTRNGTMFVTGGSYQDTPFSPRSFFNDVYATEDGITWRMLTAQAAFPACSGPRLVEFKNELYLLGGEDGFTEQTQYNHVYSTVDGVEWNFVTNATWSIRSGHGVVVHDDKMYVIAGYLDLHDLWVSDNAQDFTLATNSSFNCDKAACGRYDFWSVVNPTTGNLFVYGGTAAVSTFGGMYDETWSVQL